VQQSDSDGGLSTALLKPVLFAWAVVFLWLIATRVYNPDEFEALHQGWLLFTGEVQYVDFNSNHPPILFQLLRLLHYVSHKPTVLLHLARMISVAAAIATLFFVYRIGCSVFDKTAARWAVIVFAINATLWEWMVEIRTDTLLVPVWLAAISLVVDARRPNALRAVLVGLLMGTACWINQKVVLHAAPLGIFMILGGGGGHWKPKDWVLSVLVSLIPAVVVLEHAASLGALGSLIENNFLGGGEMVMADPFVSSRDLTQQAVFRHDFGWVVLSFISFLCLSNRMFACRNEQRFVFLGTLWMLLTFFWTPGPFGYYMMSVFPLASIIVGGFLSGLPWGSMIHQYRARVVICFIAYCLFPLGWLVWFVQPTNRYQREVISVGMMLTDNESKVLDLSACLINRSNSYPFHTRQTKAERKRFAHMLPALIPEVKRNGCDLMFKYDRTDPMPGAVDVWQPGTWDTLSHQFVRICGPIHVPGYDSIDPVNESEIEIELWFDGNYETRTSGLLIDHEPFTGDLALEAGMHTVTLAEPGQRIQIVSTDYRKRGVLPSDSERSHEFLYAYWTQRPRHCWIWQLFD